MKSVQSILTTGLMLSISGVVFAQSPAVLIPPAAAAAAASTSIDIEKSFNEFRSKFQDISGLFSASEFRTVAEQKFIDKIKWGKSDVIVKLNAFKKKLDLMQKRNRAQFELSAVAVSPVQMPRLYKLASQAAAALELSQNFHVFVVNAPEFNAYTYSYNADDFDVVLYSGAVENLSDDAILALFGHEMGHVKDQAILSQVILSADFESRNKDTSSASHQAFYDNVFNELPTGMRNRIAHDALDLVANNDVIMAFENDAAAGDFARNCELTADRAAVIVTGDAKAPLKLLSSLAYGSKSLTPELNIDELIKQIRSVLATSEAPDEIEYLVQNQGSHPFNVLRLIEVSDFAASATYKELKDRINEAPFAKELDVFTNIVEGGTDVLDRFKKYMAGTDSSQPSADTDDTLVRLKAEDSYDRTWQRFDQGAKTLSQQLLEQLAASGLAAPKDEFFEELVAKMKSDKTESLKGALIEAVSNLLTKQIAVTPGKDTAQLNAKLKIIQGLVPAAAKQAAPQG